MKKIIGFPSQGPDLLDNISPHFGHCEYWVGIEIDEDNNFKKIFSEVNNGHSACMEPVFQMKEKKVTDFIVMGIGGRPFSGFIQFGINIYEGVEGSLKKNLEFFLQGKLRALGGPSCSSHDNNGKCHH